MRVSRSFVIAAGLFVTAGSAMAQEAKKASRAGEAERVGQFLEQHAKADPAWAGKQCQLCHVVPEAARPRIVSPPKDKALSVRGGEPHYFEYHEEDFQPNEFQRFAVIHFDPSSQSLDGLTVAPVDEAIRRHLKIPTQQGLVVTSVDVHSPTHAAGVSVHDVLLKVDDRPIVDSKTFAQALRSADGKPVVITLVREGETQVIHVSPRVKIVLERIVNDEPNYPKFWIGVSAGPVEPALRSQLRLPEGQGLQVQEVHAGSPAAKAGIEAGHILMSIDGQPLDNALRLRQLVEAAQNRPLDLIYYRAGSKAKYGAKLTPEPYKPEPPAAKTSEKGTKSPGPEQSSRVIYITSDFSLAKDGQWILNSSPQTGLRWTVPPVTPGPAPAPDLTNRLNALDAEMREVRSSLQKIEQALGKLGAAQK